MPDRDVFYPWYCGCCGRALPEQYEGSLWCADCKGHVAPLFRKWDTPANLREREHAQQIECQDAFSGRWRPAFDHYWDDCVIEVKWRWIERAEGMRSDGD